MFPVIAVTSWLTHSACQSKSRCGKMAYLSSPLLQYFLLYAKTGANVISAPSIKDIINRTWATDSSCGLKHLPVWLWAGLLVKCWNLSDEQEREWPSISCCSAEPARVSNFLKESLWLLLKFWLFYTLDVWYWWGKITGILMVLFQHYEIQQLTSWSSGFHRSYYYFYV